MPDSTDWRAILVACLYALWWPFDKFLKALVLVLAPIWSFISFILLPFIHLAQTIYHITTFPLRGAWLERIEVVLILHRSKIELIRFRHSIST